MRYAAARVEKISVDLPNMMPNIKGSRKGQQRLLIPVAESIALEAWTKLPATENLTNKLFDKARMTLVLKVFQIHRTVSR